MAARQPDPDSVYLTLEFDAPMTKADIRQRCRDIAAHLEEDA